MSCKQSSSTQATCLKKHFDVESHFVFQNTFENERPETGSSTCSQYSMYASPLRATAVRKSAQKPDSNKSCFLLAENCLRAADLDRWRTTTFSMGHVRDNVRARDWRRRASSPRRQTAATQTSAPALSTQKENCPRNQSMGYWACLGLMLSTWLAELAAFGGSRCGIRDKHIIN